MKPSFRVCYGCLLQFINSNASLSLYSLACVGQLESRANIPKICAADTSHRNLLSACGGDLTVWKPRNALLLDASLAKVPKNMSASTLGKTEECFVLSDLPTAVVFL